MSLLSPKLSPGQHLEAPLRRGFSWPGPLHRGQGRHQHGSVQHQHSSRAQTPLTPHTRQASNTYPLAKILNPETPEPSIIDSSFKTMGTITVCQNRRYEAFCVSSLLIRPPRFCQTSLTMSDRDIPPLITMSR